LLLGALGVVYGVISLVFWTITVIVSLKYVTFVLRADNDGEGGVMALAALVRRVVGDVHGRAAVMALGVLGASLFYGDSVITQRGRQVVTARRTAKEGPLPEFVERLRGSEVVRVPGTAVFPHPTMATAPLALRADFEHNHVVHRHFVIVSMVSENASYVSAEQRISADNLEYRDVGIVHLTARYGFKEHQDLPAALRLSREPGMSRWRKKLFLALAHNAPSPAEYFYLPESRTVVMGSQVDL
jgi:KUP system potassium uptake protein